MVFIIVLFLISILLFTPLNISNGTPGGRHSKDLRATLPINELKGNPPVEDCPISNLHRCKTQFASNGSVVMTIVHYICV
jgi:hypothetical protein